MNGKYVVMLREKGVKITPQRLEIMKYLDEHREHPTAEEIYKVLKKRFPSLSKTTVYNNLELLKRYKLLQAVMISGNELRFDFWTGSHHHFQCNECGKIIDIDIPCPNLDTMLHGKHKIDEVHGYFKGTCEDCLTKKNKNKNRGKAGKRSSNRNKRGNRRR